MRTGLAHQRAATMTIVAALLLLPACGRVDGELDQGPAVPLPKEPGPIPDELRALGYGGWDDEAGLGQSGSGSATSAGVILWNEELADPRARIWADDRSTLHVIAPSGRELKTMVVPRHTQLEFARALPGGRIIALSVDQGLTLLEGDGTLVWQITAPCHHEVTLVPRPGAEPGSRLFAAALHYSQPLAGRDVYFDEVTFFEEATGEASRDPAWQPWSTWEHREALDGAVGGSPHALSMPPAKGAGLAPLKAPRQNPGPAKRPTYDYFHLNGIAFDGPETMVVCLRNVSLLAEVSLPDGSIAASYGPGMLDWPHAPSFVTSTSGVRSLLAFDNGAHRGWSRIVEISRETGELTWEWKGTDERPLWSKVRGFAERLPGGRTLITESERGRALEITRAGEIVWEFQNPETRPSAAGRQRRRIYRITLVPGQ